MARAKTRWTCQQCGFQSSKFLGKCTDCQAWNTLVEEVEIDTSAMPLRARAVVANAQALALPLSEIELTNYQRLPTGIASLDEVLGGGLVPGAVILLAGEPGIGKSTFLLQVAEILARRYKVLYVSAEESQQQVCLRARRLEMQAENLLIASEQNVEHIQAAMQAEDVQLAVVDSVQAVFHPEIGSAPGSVSQVRESAAALLTVAKDKNICTILVGHVTKDGSIAGPRVLEHMVDVVLQLEGDRLRQLRVLKAIKNRFGSTQEIAIFSMSDRGLKEIDNPSALFLGDRLNKRPGDRAPSGTCVLASAEGNRSLLLEVQALVGTSVVGNPRRVANGCDQNRLLQIIAVLEKRVGLPLSRQDVYVNIVGGFESGDPAGDLGIAIAVATSAMDRSVDPYLVAVGEIGLAGEVRPVASLERRLKEAAALGFKKALVPAANLPLTGNFDRLNVTGVQYLAEALNSVMPGASLLAGKKSGSGAPGAIDQKGAQAVDDEQLARLLQ